MFGIIIIDNIVINVPAGIKFIHFGPEDDQVKTEELVPSDRNPLEEISPPTHQALETPPAFVLLLGSNNPDPVKILRSSYRPSRFRYPTPPPSYEEATRTSQPALPPPVCPNSPQSRKPPSLSSIPYRCSTPPPSTNLNDSFTFLNEKPQSLPTIIIPLIKAESPEHVVGYP